MLFSRYSLPLAAALISTTAAASTAPSGQPFDPSFSAHHKAAAPADVTTSCQFTTEGSTLTLTGDCVTDGTLLVPSGFTLDGAGHVITAIDPSGGHFTGAIIQNEGDVAHIHNVVISAAGLKSVCDQGEDRLRGIYLRSASGTIVGNDILGLNQGESTCQEGNAIEAYNPADANGAGETLYVEIGDNRIRDFQKTGISIGGLLDADVHGNDIGASANQAFIAANGIQAVFGATGFIEDNAVAGNSWAGNEAASTAIITHQSGAGLTVRNNRVRGNADVGILVESDEGRFFHNMAIESGEDGYYDVGIFNNGESNSFGFNRVYGYEQPYYGVTGIGNR